MKSLSLVLAALILLCLGAVPSLAQYDDGYDEEYYDGYEGSYTCWACPNCGFVAHLDLEVDESAIEYQTTLGEVLYLNPYDPEDYCPSCGTYGAYFVLVPCSEHYEDVEEYGGDEEYEEAEYTEGGEEFEGGDEIEGDETEEVPAPASTEALPEEAGKILIVVPPKDFNDQEFSASETRFLDEGFEVVVASEGTDEAIGMEGTSIAVDLAVADAEVSNYEAVVFIGGPGVDDLELYEDPDYLDLASSAQRLDLVVGAICVAPKILANAELLEGKNATVFPDTESIAYLESKGAIYSDEEVARDEKIITACGPEAAEAFAEAVAAALREDRV